MKAKTTTPENILLGYGIVEIDGTPIGLTRGGSTFVVEREVREIEADGDKGIVKGRVVIDREDAKLTVNALEIFSSEELSQWYSGTELTEQEIRSTLQFADSDYREVVWKGKTLAGKPVTITLPNALNTGNLELTLEDKDEVVPELEFTATYAEEARDKSSWSISFGGTE